MLKPAIRTTKTFPLHSIALDRSLETPLHRQIFNQIRRMIAERTLAAGSVLPSSRSLSEDLHVARNVVITAYEQLSAEGYVQNRPGTPPRVTEFPGAGDERRGRGRAMGHAVSARGELLFAQPAHHGTPGQLTLHPGMPDAESFPFSAWSRIIARRSKAGRHDLFGTYNVIGYPALREAIATYIGAARGVRCTPEQVVVTTGAQASLDLLARILLDPGDCAWVEEPGYYGAQGALAAAGVTLAPLQVGRNGWRLDPPAGAKPRLIYVTPACQYPLGVTMRAAQRTRLLELAEAFDSWILEDDFDGEYRFQGDQVAALQSIDQSDRVIYIGTFAKLLFPALRIGFMVLPANLQERMARALSVTGQFAPLLLQAALADFIDQGYMSRHLRRMRRLYNGRRQTFCRLARDILGDWLTLETGDAGIQIAASFRRPIDDVSVAAAAVRGGINVSPLSIHYRGDARQAGLVMGYAATPETAMPQALRVLRGILRQRESN